MTDLIMLLLQANFKSTGLQLKQILSSIIVTVISVLVYAQDTDTTRLSEFVVSAQRSPTDPSRTGRNVIIIDRLQIEAAPVQSVAELLEYTGNVDIRQRGPQGVQSDVSIRGGSFDQVLILINGVKLADPQTGHHSMNLPIDLSQVERIEIVKGGGSRVLGPNAFAGAINIITKKEVANEVAVQLTGGDFNLLGGNINLAYKTGKVHHQFAYAQRSSEGFVENTDFEWQNLYYQAFANLGNHRLTFMLGLNDKGFGASTFYSRNFPLQYEATQTQFTALTDNWQLNERTTLVTRAYLRRHYDRFELFRETGSGYFQQQGGALVMGTDTVPSWYPGPNYHQTISSGAEFNLTRKSNVGISSIGYDLRAEQLYSNNLGELMEEPIDVVGSSDGKYTKQANRTNHSIYAEHRISEGRVSIAAGAMVNINSDFGTDYFPGIDVTFQASDSWSIFASHNKSVRFPTYTDLYYNLGGATGSIDLEQESSLNYELGTTFKFKRAQVKLAGFERQGKNLIDWVVFNGTTNAQAANLTELDIYGVEVEGHFQVKSLERLLGLKQLSLGYSWMDATQRSDGFESAYVLDFLQHKADLGLRFSWFNKFTTTFQLSAQDRLGGYFNSELNREEEFDLFLLADIRVAYRHKAIEVFAEASNLFNAVYTDIANVPQPERWARGGLRLRLGL